MPVRAQGDAGWILGQINALRAHNGAGPLSVNAALVNSATAHSQYLANSTWSDPHVEANGSTPRSRTIAAGFTGPIGENVYGGGTATAAIAFTWWVNEPTHFRSMVNQQFNVLGVGIASGTYGHYFTIDFGGDGSINVAPVLVNNNMATSSTAASNLPAVPLPTHRPRPTDTPTITFTPSITYTPFPTNTVVLTDMPILPTASAIVLEVSPQAAYVTAYVTATIDTPPTSTPTPLVVALLPSPTLMSPISPTASILKTSTDQPSTTPGFVPISVAKPNLPSPPGSSSNNLFGLLIMVGVGIQGVILAGFVVRQLKSR